MLAEKKDKSVKDVPFMSSVEDLEMSVPSLIVDEVDLMPYGPF